MKMTLKWLEHMVNVDEKRSEKFEVAAALRQGDLLSAILFNFVLEKGIGAQRAEGTVL